MHDNREGRIPEDANGVILDLTCSKPSEKSRFCQLIILTLLRNHHPDFIVNISDRMFEMIIFDMLTVLSGVELRRSKKNYCSTLYQRVTSLREMYNPRIKIPI